MEATQTSDQLTLFAAASRSCVRTSPLPARAQALMASAADYGRSTPELLARFDPATRSWRTSQYSLLGGLTEFSETWPRSGLMRNGTAYLLPPLVPLTDAIEYGLLPTPAAVTYGTNQGGGMGRVGPVRPSLDTMAGRGLWPTPVTGESISGHGRRGGRPGNGRQAGRSLDAMVKLWPTPTSGDAKASGSRNMDSSEAHPGLSLTDAVREDGGTGRSWASPSARDWRSGRGRSENGHTPQLPEQAGGQLNPTWVEWLMGFPIGWTDCGPSATRSSRKSRS